jgi:AcrR family transcriptional regulator
MSILRTLALFCPGDLHLRNIKDRRVERTRLGLLTAFRDLVLERGYDRLSVRDIIRHANIARSTFYEHFEDKDDMFRQSMKPLFSVLAGAIDDSPSLEKIILVVEHFWEKRRLTRTILGGSTRKLMWRFLSELIEEKLLARARSNAETHALVPPPMVAAQLAGGQLALIESWLARDAACSPDALARAIYVSTNSSALLKPAPPAALPPAPPRVLSKPTL